MSIIEKQLEMAEAMYAKKKSIKTSFILVFRNWLKYKYTGNAMELNKSYHVAVIAYNANTFYTPVILCLMFIEIELQHYERCEELLEILSQYKNYYKSNEPLLYAILIYLTAMLQIRTEKIKQSKKSIKILNDIIKESENPYYYMLLGSLEKELGELNESYNSFLTSYTKGCRSFFLYISLYELFINNWRIADSGGLFLPILLWYKGDDPEINNTAMINYKSAIEASLTMRDAQKIYSKYKETWALEFICKYLASKYDYSGKAYLYYKEAELKQVNLPELDKHLVRSSFFNKKEDLSHYTLEKFLSRNEFDDSLKCFIYHLIITNKKLKDFSESRMNEILQFAVFSLENEKRGRAYNSIYGYFLEKAEKLNINKDYIKKCENILKDDIFQYRTNIENKSIKKVLIFEKEKKEASKFSVSGDVVKITAATSEFTYICLDETEKNIIDAKLNFVKLVENADFFLYNHFFTQGYLEPDIIIALARLYIEGHGNSGDGVYVLNAALLLKNLSVNFRMVLSASLGNLLASQNRYDKAIEYYNGVDENYLSDQYIELMLIAFINAKEYEKAAKLVIKKSHCITERTLAFCLKQIAMAKIYNDGIADIAYELILKSWYDKSLIDIIIKHYSGSQEEWQELSKVLSNISVFEPEVDKKILSNSIWMHKLDDYSQKVFVRMYEMNPENKLVQDFAYYMIYEILVNNVKPIYESIEILEKLYQQNKVKIFAFGLFTLYMEKSIVTFSSDAIIKEALQYMEEERILFPAASKLKDKNTMTPYILKNHPFIYRSLPNRNAYVHYKTESDDKTYTQKMKYVQFGLYLSAVPVFYGEKIVYHFSEELRTGSITTKPEEVSGIKLNIVEASEDEFFTINNALIYEHMFKYEQVEGIITESLKNTRNIKGILL